MATQLELFDLASKGTSNKCWAYNVWKIRQALNYKGLLYKTTWLDQKNLAPTLQALGVPQNHSGGFPWTVPTIKFADGKVIMDSTALADKLEEIQPFPSLHIDKELQAEAEKIVFSIAFPVFPIYMPRTAKSIVVESALPGFRAVREQMLGASFDVLEKTPPEKAWAEAKPGLKALKKFLTSKKVNHGPFIKGSTPCFADFIVVAMIESFRHTGEDLYEGFVKFDPSIQNLYDACKEWLKRDN